MSVLTRSQKDCAKRVVRACSADEGAWYRAQTAGERVTLPSLVDRGVLVRRAWRGDGIDRNRSAFEYRPSAALLEAVRARTATA